MSKKIKETGRDIAKSQPNTKNTSGSLKGKERTGEFKDGKKFADNPKDTGLNSNLSGISFSHKKQMGELIQVQAQQLVALEIIKPEIEKNVYDFMCGIRVGSTVKSQDFTFFLWTWVKCLNLFEGVECEIVEIAKGSWIVRFLIKCKDLATSISTKELLLETVADLAKGALAPYTKGGAEVDRIKSESAKGNAEADRIIKETEALPDSDEARELRDLQTEALKLELEEKRAEIEAKKIANAKASLDLAKDLKEMMKEGILAVDEITMDIEGVPILIKKGNDITAPQSIEGSA